MILFAILIYIKAITTELVNIQYLSRHINLHQDNRCRNILHALLSLHINLHQENHCRSMLHTIICLDILIYIKTITIPTCT